jgi:hypothetical protein
MSFRNEDPGYPFSATTTADLGNLTFGTADTFTINSEPARATRSEAWKAEWKKFRDEFIRKLLVDDPEDIFEFQMERKIEHYNNVKVKVTIEYSPDYKKEGKARR